MELALIRSLMDREFYEDHRGARCPNRLFSKDVRKIKEVIDNAMTRYDRTVTPDEIEALFMSNNPSMTTAQKGAYSSLFLKIKKEQKLGEDIAKEVLSKLFQQIIGEDIANLGFDYVNGAKSSLEPLRALLEQYGDDFTPSMDIQWDDISIETLLAKNDLEARWSFNIPSLCRKVEGINAGHLVEIGARPNTGKTSFHASLIAGPGGFAEQGAKCIVLCNEEAYTRVASRYISASTLMTMKEVRDNKALAAKRYNSIKDLVQFKDSTGKGMDWVESVVKYERPDVVILDMGDKFADIRTERTDITFKAAAIHARNIAKQYDCAVVWMSQLSAEAEGRADLNQAMMEGSKTGKAAEAALMLLIGKTLQAEGEEEDPIRYLNIAKNKLNGFQGKITCQLDGSRSLYTA